jgi:hypothetical protein
MFEVVSSILTGSSINVNTARTVISEIATEKAFDAVKFMRQHRDKLSEKLSKMTKEEILEYFKKRKSQLTIKPCA